MKRSRLIVMLARFFSPGYGWCYCCGMPWRFTKPHTTHYGGLHRHGISYGSGCFPLCERCWEGLETPERRMPYYEQLIHSWNKGAIDYGLSTAFLDTREEQILDAVWAEGPDEDMNEAIKILGEDYFA